MSSFLERVAEKVHGPRQADYGHPSLNHTTTHLLWSVYLARAHGVELQLTVQDVAALNILQKLSRLGETPGHEDSWEDIAGYAENAVRDLEDPLCERA